MRQLALLAGALALVIGVSGCGGDKDEAAVKEHLECLKALNKVLDGVKDAETLKAAKSKIESLGKDLDAARAKVKAVPTDKATELLKKYGAEVAKEEAALTTNRARVAVIEGAGKVGDLLGL